MVATVDILGCLVWGVDWRADGFQACRWFYFTVKVANGCPGVCFWDSLRAGSRKQGRLPGGGNIQAPQRGEAWGKAWDKKQHGGWERRSLRSLDGSWYLLGASEENSSPNRLTHREFTDISISLTQKLVRNTGPRPHPVPLGSGSSC